MANDAGDGVILLLALGCTDKGPVVADDTGVPVESREPTDTFPSFYGKVPKNLLMVSMDTFRRDLLTRYGGAGDAPFLDRLVAEGVPLDRHRSCSNWTFPSVMCVVEGATNVDAGYAPDLQSLGEGMMPDTLPTLAGRLTDAGYRTMLVTSNSFFSYDHNTDAGFETADRPVSRTTTDVFEQGRARLVEARTAGEDRWYLHLHVKEPHPAYSPPDEYLGALEGLPELPWDLDVFDEHYAADAAWPAMTDEERAELLEQLLIRYHGEVAWMDDQLEAEFALLDAAGFLDDTLVVFWTDHGEQFWEHGQQTHAYDLHAEENDAVAFFWAKNIVAGEWTEPTSHIDLAPSVLDLFGVDATGTTGVPVGSADPERPIHTLAVARLGVVQGVVKDGWKLRYRWDTGERSLYDTVGDPGETVDLYDAADPRVIELEGLIAPETEVLGGMLPEHTPR